MSSSKGVVEISRYEAENGEADQFRPWNVSGLEQCGKEGFPSECTEDENGFKVLYEHEEDEEDHTFYRLYEVKDASGDGHGGDGFEPFSAHGLGRKKGRGSDPSEKRHQSAASDISSTASGVPHATDSSDDAFSPLVPEEMEGDSALSRGRAQSEGGASQGGDGIDRGHGAEVDENPSGETGNGADPPSISREAQEAILEEAFAKGFDEGKKQGFEAGQESGRETGYQEGYDKGEQEGYDAGLAKGEADGKMLSEAQARELIDSLEAMCHKAEEAWQTMVKESESQILSLIGKIAEKVVMASVDLSEGAVRASVLEALSVMPDPEEIVLNIAPEDYEYIEMVKEDFFEAFKSLKHVSVVSNPAVSRGGCKIESSKGRVETDVASRLEAVKNSMLAAHST